MSTQNTCISRRAYMCSRWLNVIRIARIERLEYVWERATWSPLQERVKVYTCCFFMASFITNMHRSMWAESRRIERKKKSIALSLIQNAFLDKKYSSDSKVAGKHGWSLMPHIYCLRGATLNCYREMIYYLTCSFLGAVGCICFCLFLFVLFCFSCIQ